MNLLKGIPVETSELMVRRVVRVKRWKRLNRPDKVRRREFEIPCAMKIGGTLFVHPAILERLRHDLVH